MTDITREMLAIREARVLVLGDAMIDEYVGGSADRISPEAPVPVVRRTGRREVPGGAANVAANIAALGATAVLVARIGEDDAGHRLRALCAQAGVDVGGCVTEPGVPTTCKTRVLAGYQQIVRIDDESLDQLGADAAERALAAVDAFLAERGPRAIVLADYAKGMLSDTLIAAVMERSAGAGVPVVVDPKDPNLRRYRGATVLKPNGVEARAALVTAPDDPAELAEAVRAAAAVDNVVLSLSEHGVVAVGRAFAQPLRLGSHVLRVADVSGAGDTMVSVLALGCAAGVDMARTVALANVAAGAVCGKLGTATLTASELLAAFHEQRVADSPEKWLADRDTVARICAAERADGRRVVFANGCFDILHAGHVRLLQAARGMGDVLLVALNGDESVRRLKGPTRPVSPLEDRVAVMSALGCVDFVCAFSEDTPLELILAAKPAVIVKGGDYHPDEVVGGREARAWGGQVAIIELLEGRSTTRLLRAGA